MTDITEIATQEGKLFLCVVLDLFSKVVMGWSMHHRQDRQMVIRAVEMAVWQREGDGAVILHSDRGCQFASGGYQRFLRRNTLLCGMSAVGHCGDNAACESFSASSSANACTTGATGHETKHGPICLIILTGSTIQGCRAASPFRI